MSNPTRTFYRLRELIYTKYGKGRFALGCEITARWVAFETRQKCSMEDVQIWCNVIAEEMETTYGTRFNMSLHQARALMQLFGIKNELELFNTSKS